MATTSAYRLEWPVGPDRLLLVSVGTGTTPIVDARLSADDMTLLYDVSSVPSALRLSSLVQQDLLCRVFGRCRIGDAIDGEVGTLIPGEEEERRAAIPKLFTYLRYHVELSRGGLDGVGVTDLDPRPLQQLDSVRHLAELQCVGRAVAARVRAKHFADVLPADRSAPRSVGPKSQRRGRSGVKRARHASSSPGRRR